MARRRRAEIRKILPDPKYNSVDLAKFINNVMLMKANKLLNIECHYTKYRVSNNTNSSDAGTFHRDIIMVGQMKNLDILYMTELLNT